MSRYKSRTGLRGASKHTLSDFRASTVYASHGLTLYGVYSADWHNEVTPLSSNPRPCAELQKQPSPLAGNRVRSEVELVLDYAKIA